MMRKHYHHQSQQQQSLWSLRTLWARTISWVGHSLGVCAFHHDHSLTHCLYARLSCYVVLSFDLTDCCAAGCKVPCGKSDAAAMLSMEGERGWGECQCDFFFFFSFFFRPSLLLSSSTRRRFYPQRSSGQIVVKGVVPSLRYVPSFLSRIGFSIPTARRFSSNVANSRSRAFR